MLKQIIAQNIVFLRKQAGMTQLDLAEKLNYSDKAVSKWERGDSVPDIAVLKEIADLFGVTVDYLLKEDHAAEEEAARLETREKRRSHQIIAALVAVVIWLVATAVFVNDQIRTENMISAMWTVFIYAFPISCAVIMVFSAKWFSRRTTFAFLSCVMWGLLLSAFVTNLFSFRYNWVIFLVGIPAQAVIILWANLPGRKAKTAERLAVEDAEKKSDE